MISVGELEEGEFAEVLGRSGLPVPPDELPGLKEQFDRLKRHLETLDRAAADLEGLEPGFLFEAEWRA